jgi:hypothetical protein
MNTVHLRRSDPTVDRIVRAAWPSYNGQHVSARLTDSVRFYGTQWDEGRKRDYAILRLADMQRVEIDEAPFVRHSELHERDHKIPDGFVVVVFNDGPRQSIEIITPPANVSNLLPPPTELSEDERTVLIATRQLKSSYGGVPNYRFHEAKRARGITLDRWEAAKASLITKKLLTKAGAITPEGRNAVRFEQL